MSNTRHLGINERLLCYVIGAALVGFLQASDGLTEAKAATMWTMDWARFWCNILLSVVLVWRAFIDQSMSQYAGPPTNTPPP